MTFIKKKFKELVDYKSGYTWSKDQELKIAEPNSIRVLTVSNIQTELVLSSVLYLKNVAQKDRLNKAASKKWSIAVSSNGNRKRIGNAVFINEDTEYLYASFLTGFIPKENSGLLPEYFFRWFSSYQVQEKISEVAEGTTELRNMSLRHLRNSFIEYPENPAEQRTIAYILTKVDEAIAATKNSIAKAERLKKALMQNLLTGKLKPDGTWRKEDEFYKDEKFGNVPIGWKVQKLKKVFKLKNGKGNPTTNLKSKPEGDFNIPVYGGNGITGYFDAPFLTKITLIVGRVGEYCGSVYKTPEKCWVTDNALWISEVFEKEFDLDFWFFALTYKKLNQYGDATGQPKITQSGIGNLKLSFPENEIEQKQIAEKIIGIETILNSKQTKIKKLERLKKALMQNLLTGKVRVKVNEIVNG